MKITILTLFLSILAALPMKMFVFYEEEDKEDIELEGNTEDDNKKSLVIPFRAYQVDNAEIRVMSYDTCTNVNATNWTMGNSYYNTNKKILY